MCVSIYWGICFTAVIWSWTRNISEVCLYYVGLLLKLFQLWLLRVLSDWLLCPYDKTPLFYFLSICLLSGTIRCSRLILYFPCPCPKIGHFSKEPWFHLLENDIRNQYLGAGYAHCYWGVIVSKPLSVNRAMKYAYVKSPTYTHIYNSINPALSILN